MDSILIKIKKLLDKANSTDSKEESDAFMLKVQELLQSHNLEISHVESIDLGSNIQENSSNYEETWEMLLVSRISSHNFCRVINYPKLKKFSIIGKKYNIEICQYLYSFYRNTLLNLSIKSYQEMCDSKINELKLIGITLTRKDFRKVSQNNFIKEYLIGGCEGIDEKLYLAKKKAEQNNSSLTGLILYNDKEIQKYIDEKIGKIKTKKSYTIKDNTAFEKGFEDGKNINEVTGVNSENKNVKSITSPQG